MAVSAVNILFVVKGNECYIRLNEKIQHDHRQQIHVHKAYHLYEQEHI